MLESSLEVTVGGDSVSFHFTVSNGGDTPVELTFRDACKADFAVHGDGEVWRYSDDRTFAQMLTTAELQPGEAASFDAKWPDPDTGDYTAEATLRVVERDVIARTPFSV